MGVCITVYYLHLHFLKLSELAAEEAQELAELAILLPTLNPQYTHDTITQMWSDLWLAYQLALGIGRGMGNPPWVMGMGTGGYGWGLAFSYLCCTLYPLSQ